MMHDFAITEHHVVWLDLPMTFQWRRMVTTGMPFGWDEEYGARLGVMRQDDPDARVRWFEIDPRYAFHAPATPPATATRSCTRRPTTPSSRSTCTAATATAHTSWVPSSSSRPTLPGGVPSGFHGSWIPDAALNV